MRHSISLRSSVLLASLAAVALVTSACGDPASDNGGSDSDNDKAVTVALVAEPSSLNVHKIDNNAQRQVMLLNVVEGLTEMSPDVSEVMPALATSWKEVDPTTTEFKLRPDVTFSNGEPFNADAVVANVEDILNGDPTELSSQLGGIVEATKVDDLTVDIKTSAPDPIIAKRVSYLMIVAPSTLSDKNWSDDPIGTGPYSFVKWNKGTSIELKANPTWWGDPKPQASDVTFIWRDEPSVRVSTLTAGEADLVKDIPSDSANQVPQLLTAPTSETALIRLNAYRFPTSDERVREAMQLAINVPEIIDTVFGGKGSVAQGQPMPPQAFGFNPDLKPAGYDPDRAKQLIQEAGAEGAKVDIVNASGTFQGAEDVLQVVAADLKAVGLDATVKNLPFDQWFDYALYDQKADKSKMPVGLFAPSSNELMDAARPVPQWLVSVAPFGLPPKNAEIDRLNAKAATNLNPDQREEEYQRIFAIENQQHSLVLLYQAEYLWGARDGINWTPRTDDLTKISTLTFD
jgi:peptide/nickel transport system substrate-binding protein